MKALLQQFREWLRTKNGKRVKVIAALLLMVWVLPKAFGGGEPGPFPGIPEISVASMANALTLLIGGICALRGRRSGNRHVEATRPS